jgi:hypothetical protein
MEKLDGDLDAARSKIGAAVQAIGTNLHTIGTAALAGIGTAVGILTAGIAGIGKLTIDAAPIEGVAAAFEGLAESAGSSGDVMLEALQKGSSGMITNADLMKSYNQAAQLVGLEFANKLPDAMKYLMKVSAATGQDMGFMMESLVKGVGRMSPMILDNLGIQVSLAEATANAAEMYGVEESALSKAQLQAGMMNVVLEKLAVNTEAMPDVTDKAAAKFAQFKVNIQNAKDEIGLAFLPILSTVMTTLSGLVKSVMPTVTKALEKVVPVVLDIASAFGTFILSIANGQSPLDALKTLMGELLPPEMAERFSGFVDKVSELGAKVSELLAPVMQWLGENVKLQDVLIALGIAIGTVIVPAIGTLISTLAPIIGTFLLVTAAITALRLAWENDFMGIRTALTDAWEGSIKPALEELWAWLQVNIPAAIATVTEWWNGTFLPVLQAVWSFIQSSIIPVFQAIGDLLSVVIGGAISIVSAMWSDIFLPALQIVWDFLQANIFPLFAALADLLSAVVGVAVTALAGIWQNVLAPALETVFGWLADKLQPAFEVLRDVIGVVGDWISGKLGPAFDSLGSKIQAVVGWIKDLADKIRNLELPDWLTPGSPTPFEIGLVGIGKALQDLNTMYLPKFFSSLQISESGLVALGGNTMQPIQQGGGITQADLDMALQNQARFFATAVATAVAQRMG